MKTVDVKEAEQMLNAIEVPKKNGRKAKIEEQKTEKKAAKKHKKEIENMQQSEPSLGDVLDKIHKACDARSLSVGSRRSAVSMANTMFKEYGRLPTVEEVTKDAANPKQRGNFRWLLKLIS